MQTVDDYLDAARRRHDLSSDRQLARALRVTAATVNGWRTKRTWPSDDTMIRLASMADADVSHALADLNVWRSKSPEARSAYQQLAAQLGAVVLAVHVGLFSIFASPDANASGTDGEQTAVTRSIYYVKFFC